MKNLVNTILGITILNIATLLMTSCNNDNFLIAKNQVGSIKSDTQVKDIQNLFPKDSVTTIKSEGILGDNDLEESEYLYVFDKVSKEKILRITPKDPSDNTSTIRCVTVYNERFQTKNGINIKSPFEQIRLKEHIEKTETTFTKILLYLDEINVVINLDKSTLNTKEISLREVLIEQIPNKTKPQNLVVWFE